MELLLWLYLYDNRWFFNIKVPTKIYKFLWAFPIFIHFMIFSAGIYYLNFVDDYQCTNTLKMWILHRTFFSILMILNIIIFLIKIQTLLQKEKLSIDESTKIFIYHPQNHLNSLNFDQIHLSFWIRRNSLISTSGILLLIQGFISIYYSYLIRNLITSQYFRSCDYKIKKALSLHSYSIYVSNIVLIIVILLMIKIKVFHFIMGMFFPRKYAIFMKNMAKFYRMDIFKFNFSFFSFYRNRNKNSINTHIIKEGYIPYDKINLENEKFFYSNKNKLLNNNTKLITKQENNIQINWDVNYSSNNDNINDYYNIKDITNKDGNFVKKRISNNEKILGKNSNK
jgi:hypothetical protein